MELNKLLKRIGKISLWTTACFFVALILLYFTRIPLSIGLLEIAGEDKNLSVDCLDWKLNLNLSLIINEVCFTSEIGKLEANKIAWPLLGSKLDIQQLAIKHIPAEQKGKTDAVAFNLDGFSLPDDLPLVQIEYLDFESYLLEKPIKLTIQQDSINSLIISGDIDTTIKFVESNLGNSLNANITWKPATIINAVPQLKTLLLELDPYLNSQLWKHSEISSTLTIAGSKITSSHSLTIGEQIKYAGCNTDISITGTIETRTSTDTLVTQLDMTQLPIVIAIDECEKLAVLKKDLAINSLILLAENPIEITPNRIKLTDIQIQNSVSPSNLRMTLKDAEFHFDNSKPNAGHFVFQLDMPYNSQIAKAEFKALFMGEFKQQTDDVFVTVNTENFEVNNLSLEGDTSANIDKISVVAKGQYKSGVFETSGNISSSKIRIKTQKSAPEGNDRTALINSVTSQFQIIDSNYQDIKLVLTNKISNIGFEDVSIAQISNQTTANLIQLNDLHITASSEIKKPQFADIGVNSISIQHSITAAIGGKNDKFASEGTHEFKTNTGIFGNLAHRINSETKSMIVKLPEQTVLPIQTLLAKLNEQTTLKSGFFAGDLQFDLVSNDGLGSLSLKELDIDYGEYKIRGVNMDEQFTMSSAQLQLPIANVTINSIDVGVPIDNVSIVIAAQENTFKLEESKGSIFGGQFILGEFWLDGRDQQLKISAADLSLAELAALQKQSGINVTGEVGGNLPLLISAGKLKIDQGRLANEEPGKLKITDNPAFDSIKKNQQQLALLENLEYEKLETNVTLTPDGWLKLDFSILGRNPDRNQAVNFNYGHEENIFTLLKALRITNSVQQGIEKKIEDKYSDKNNINKGNQ